jgi:hypothetical protein
MTCLALADGRCWQLCAGNQAQGHEILQPDGIYSLILEGMHELFRISINSLALMTHRVLVSLILT